MKIATWNLKRPGISSAKNEVILASLKEIDPDILVLTETNYAIDPGERYTPLSSDPLPVPGPYRYTHGENETTIWSKYPLSRVPTRHPAVSVCAKLQTPNGDLIVYGTVIGILGNRHDDFSKALKEQVSEWEEIGKSGNICIIGDFNLSFIDDFYYTKNGREEVLNSFRRMGITNTTRALPNNIDHIAISDSFLGDAKIEVVASWNDPVNKKISDHKGVCINLEYPEAG